MTAKKFTNLVNPYTKNNDNKKTSEWQYRSSNKSQAHVQWTQKPGYKHCQLYLHIGCIHVSKLQALHALSKTVSSSQLRAL